MNTELLKLAVDYGVIGILGLMSFISLYVWIERQLFYKRLKSSSYGSIDALELDLSNNLSILSSFGANAPYIGLLGTVFGIILTFYTLGQNSDIDVKEIMTSLALALKATAMGLIVAIPAILFYNHLNRKCDVLIAKWKIAKEESAA